jgi:hypothetical protein
MNEGMYRDGAAEREGLTPEDDRLSAEDRDTIVKLRQGLSLLERIEPANTPPLAWFETQLTDTKRKRRTRLIRELAVLWGAGLVLLGGLYQVLNRAPAAFLVLQAAAAASPLLLLLRAVWKGRETQYDSR